MAGAKISYKKRRSIFQRDDYTCHYCKRRATHFRDSGNYIFGIFILGDWMPFELDHIVPWSKTRNNKISNLVTACARCNMRKGIKPYKEFVKNPPNYDRQKWEDFLTPSEMRDISLLTAY